MQIMDYTRSIRYRVKKGVAKKLDGEEEDIGWQRGARRIGLWKATNSSPETRTSKFKGIENKADGKRVWRAARSFLIQSVIIMTTSVAGRTPSEFDRSDRLDG